MSATDSSSPDPSASDPDASDDDDTSSNGSIFMSFIEGVYSQIEDPDIHREVTDIVLGWIDASPPRGESFADQFTRMETGGFSPDVIRRVQANMSVPYWDRLHPQRFKDVRGVFDATVDRFEFGSDQVNRWLRPGTSIVTEAFEFHDGYLVTGRGITSHEVQQRARPLLHEDLVSLIANADGSMLVILDQEEIWWLLEAVPWLASAANGGKEWQGMASVEKKFVLVLDASLNALLLRHAAHEEIRAKDEDFPLEDGAVYLVPAGAVSPHLGATFICDHVLDFKARTTVAFIYGHEQAEATDDLVVGRDGAFRLTDYYAYEKAILGHFGLVGPLFLPAYYGAYDYYVTLVPRYNGVGGLVADPDWITYYDGRMDPDNGDMTPTICTPHRVRTGQRIRFEMGMLAILDEKHHSWKHSLYDVHWYFWQADIRQIQSFQLALAEKQPDNGTLLVSGDPLCKIDLDTQQLTRNTDGDIGVNFLSNIRTILEQSLKVDFNDYVNVVGGRMRSKTMSEAVKFGLFPRGVTDIPDHFKQVLPYDAFFSKSFYMLQLRGLYTYNYLHELVSRETTSDGTQLIEVSKQDLEEVAHLSKVIKLNGAQRRSDAREEKTHWEDMKAKREAMNKPCDPRVKAMLDAWDLGGQNPLAIPHHWSKSPSVRAFVLLQTKIPDALERMYAENPSGKKVRDGELFYTFVDGAREFYGGSCSPSEWRRAVDEFLEAERKKAQEKRAQKEAEAAAAREADSRRNQSRSRKSSEAEARRAAKEGEERAAAAQAAAELQAARDANYETVEEHKAALAKAAERAAKLAAAQQAGFATIAAHESYESNRRIDQQRKEKEALKAAHAAAQAKAKAEQGDQLVAKAKKAVKQKKQNLRNAAEAAAAAQAAPAEQAAAANDDEDDGNDVERALRPANPGKGRWRKGGKRGK